MEMIRSERMHAGDPSDSQRMRSPPGTGYVKCGQSFDNVQESPGSDFEPGDM